MGTASGIKTPCSDDQVIHNQVRLRDIRIQLQQGVVEGPRRHELIKLDQSCTCTCMLTLHSPLGQGLVRVPPQSFSLLVSQSLEELLHLCQSILHLLAKPRSDFEFSWYE